MTYKTELSNVYRHFFFHIETKSLYRSFLSDIETKTVLSLKGIYKNGKIEETSASDTYYYEIDLKKYNIEYKYISNVVYNDYDINNPLLIQAIENIILEKAIYDLLTNI